MEALFLSKKGLMILTVRDEVREVLVPSHFSPTVNVEVPLALEALFVDTRKFRKVDGDDVFVGLPGFGVIGYFEEVV
jgi:hypothetical protein